MLLPLLVRMFLSRVSSVFSCCEILYITRKLFYILYQNRDSPLGPTTSLPLRGWGSLHWNLTVESLCLLVQRHLSFNMVWLLDPSALNEYMLFYKQRFFNSASVLLTFLINWASNVAYVLLNTYKHHYTKTILLFTLFVSMSRRRPVYILSMWSIFNFYLYFYRHTFSFIYFLEYVLLFFDDDVDEECE